MRTDNIAFIDIEGYPESREHRYGILIGNKQHKSTSASKIRTLLENNRHSYICGHNFFQHDLEIAGKNSLAQQVTATKVIDTLYLSMLLSPGKSTHRLNKPYKTDIFIENQPAADCVQTKELLLILTENFENLPVNLKDSFHNLLFKNKYFQAYFQAVNYKQRDSNAHITLLKKNSHLSIGKLTSLAEDYPVEIAILCSTLINKNKKTFSKIILHTYPELSGLQEEIFFDFQNIDKYIQDFSQEEFGFSDFREFSDVNDGLFTVSQKDIIKSAVEGKSILAVLPTGGGKTFTFQLPSLIKACKSRSLTVVISPLQALMRDQISNFNKEIQNYKAAAISSYLSPIGRLETLEEIKNGSIDILYITPESLRSNTMFKTLNCRIIERFVIDEAHCFSAWGHDFRHDYYYIGQFIKELQESSYQKPIPVSCFTATARPEVLQDIRVYFKKFLDIEFESFIASSKRTNLFYKAYFFENDLGKYEKLIQIIQDYNEKPIIIYRPQNAKGCKDLVDKLNNDQRLFNYNLAIEPFYANIDNDRKDTQDTTRSKSQILEDFITNNVNIVVATTAFGMGIDKPDIQAVIHYDTSDSLEAYMQESGRGARSSNINADCIVLYTESDFERIFRNLRRNKVEYSEVEKVARIFKKQKRDPFFITTRNIAAAVGIDTEDTSKDYDLLIKTAALELEKWDIIKRGRNHTRIYATSIAHDSENKDKMPMEIVHDILDPKEQFYGENYQFMILLMQNIIQRSKEHAIEIEELSDIVGIEKRRIFKIVSDLQREELLEYQNDISIIIGKKILKEIEQYFQLENEIFDLFIKNSQNHALDLRSYQTGKNPPKKNNLNKLFKIVRSWKQLAIIHNYPIKLHFKNYRVSYDFSSKNINEIKRWLQVRQHICRYISNYCVKALSKDGRNSEEIEICSNLLFDKLIENKKVSLEFYHHSMVYLDELLEGFKLTKGRLIYYNALSFEKGLKLERPTPYY
ncbi:MAG: RecQ family ATP-dependent DNA helicase, partial [Spirochaetales bacterium]|nr:RecQ family ATP-dependent DNA helicase [Spirochaetales bacterium]